MGYHAGRGGRALVILPAREWRCDRCPAVEIQTGPRASEMIAMPPLLWTVVDTVRILPPRTVGEGDAKTKMGETRTSSRKTYCPTCSDRLEEACTPNPAPAPGK